MIISLKGSYLTVTSLARLLINRSPSYYDSVAEFPFNLVMPFDGGLFTAEFEDCLLLVCCVLED
jgi:hypothetical protein